MTEHLDILPKIEALLFVSGEPLSVSRLEKILNVSRKLLMEALHELGDKYRNDARSGLMLIEHAGAYELATRGDCAEIIGAFTKSFLQEDLSRAALEVLSIVAYRAPITRAEIESIRGVNCSFTLRNLLLRGFIDRSDNPEDTREYLYRPTVALLEKLGLGKLEDLPQFQELTQDERLKVVLEESATKTTEESLETGAIS